ncbi:MAG: glycosyltransferase [Candidatus Hodarchaeota archaeon]
MIASDPDRTIRLKKEMESLIRMGYQVEVLKPKFTFNFNSSKILVFIRYLLTAFQLLFYKADIFHVHNNPDIGFFVLFKKGKFVYDTRNPWGREVYDLTGCYSISRICEWIERTLTMRANIVIAANSRLAERVKEWGKSQVFIVPNYPSKTFRPTIEPKKMKILHNLGRKKIVVFAGNFSKVECALDLVKLFPQVLKEVPNSILIMVGDGLQKPLMQDFIKTKKLEESVILTGRLPRLEVPNWLAIADVIAVPRDARMRSAPFYCPESIWKVTEALFLGKPVLGSPVGGFIETSWESVKNAPLELFHKTLAKMLKNPPKTKIPDNLMWDYCEKQLKLAYERLRL